MGQRCSKKDLDDFEEDDDEENAMFSEEDDEFDSQHPPRSDGAESDTAGGRRTTTTTDTSDFSNQFRRKDNRARTLSADAKKRRASNYNDVHIQVSEQLKQFEDNNAQVALNRDYRPMGVVGLQNLGNTCFLNSSIQCLSATIPLTDYFLGYDYKSEINTKNFLGTGGKLATAYAQLLKEMWLSNKTVVRPVQFKKQLSKFAPQFSGTYQHDAQELLSFLLDGIHEDLNRVKDKPYVEDRDCDGKNDEADAIEAWKNYLRRNKSLIVDLFQGQLRNTCRCNVCGHTNIRFEPFMYLSLPISDSCRNLQDCLDLYISTDELRGENRWYCEKCKKHRDGTKKIDLWIVPPILIVHLKRFKYNEYGQVGSKNNAHIKFPMEGWDLSDAVKSKGSVKPVYDLYAVSNHIGGLRSGHYTAYSMTRFDEQWVEFNDSNPRPITPDVVTRNASAAYVLFYNRSDKEESVHDNESDAPTSARYPMVRRQSVTRPDLWPHTQVEDSKFRDYRRRSNAMNGSMRSLGESFHSPPTSPMPSSGRRSANIIANTVVAPMISPKTSSRSTTPDPESSSSVRKRTTRTAKKSSNRRRGDR
ncbi:Ubiquitin carboxyl-terminal hydrolase Usp2 [Seminavis robusta]|uniref:Ubiquitin carboxyl-terminal hydrolase n=1 Tax=Seminavis robusta TaxID=568900 RepID=A0A9N8E9T6_9STRA|nr:Ubiquitin carboxyl-terminal hydrolase Usp2 [Seminavis robusta]|eukprot:Sro835_g208860.1 Ubiquitin carboxyl-terminal hydrolase Usp2 (586) ;mRNA; r:28712-30628